MASTKMRWNRATTRCSEPERPPSQIGVRSCLICSVIVTLLIEVLSASITDERVLGNQCMRAPQDQA
jgi:hypothetical protein